MKHSRHGAPAPKSRTSSKHEYVSIIMKNASFKQRPPQQKNMNRNNSNAKHNQHAWTLTTDKPRIQNWKRNPKHYIESVTPKTGHTTKQQTEDRRRNLGPWRKAAQTNTQCVWTVYIGRPNLQIIAIFLSCCDTQMLWPLASEQVYVIFCWLQSVFCCCGCISACFRGTRSS